MQDRFAGRFQWIAAGVVYLGAHVLLNAFFPGAAKPVSYFFFISSCFLALVACVWRAVHGPPSMHAKWLLVAAGHVCWLVAILIEASTVLLRHRSLTTATAQDFFYFYFGVPILLAIVFPDEEDISKLFFWLDIVQAAAIGYLVYAVFYQTLPFTPRDAQTLHYTYINYLEDAENLALVLLSTVRLAASERGTVERQFSWILTCYLWVYAIGISLYNHLVGIYNTYGPLDVLSVAPFVMLALAAILMREPPPQTAPPAKTASSLTLFLSNARPILLGLALVALSTALFPRHGSIAMGFVLGAFVIYGIRSTLLQSQVQKAQHDLVEARDRLEALTMQDALTGIFNRRCFNKMLGLDWARAAFAQPLIPTAHRCRPLQAD